MNTSQRISLLISSSLLLVLSATACEQIAGFGTDKVSVEVSSTGIKTVDSDSETITDSPFGIPAANVTQNLTTALGGPIDIVKTPNCNLMLTTWPGGLETVNREGSFVSWSVWRSDDRSIVATTPDGRGIDTTLAELQSVNETTSVVAGDHNDFETADGYTGILNGNIPEAIVIAIRGGEDVYDGYQVIDNCSSEDLEAPKKE